MDLSSARYLILAEGAFSPLHSKTANGAIRYIPHQVAGIIDSTKTGRTAQEILGYGGKMPVVKDLTEGLHLSPPPTHLLIGIAPPGGILPAQWRDLLNGAIDAGLHIVSGLHTLLSDDPELRERSAGKQTTIIDLRKPLPEHHRIPSGSWKSRKPKVVLTVGTDSSIGKMSALLEIWNTLRQTRVRTEFVSTGQTGILITGWGVPVDSVISDYISGSMEYEVDRAAKNDPHLILVEGQGALTHTAYSGVTLGLMHGCMPDAMIMCHHPSRIRDSYGNPLPSLKESIALYEQVMRFFKPSKVIGLSINGLGLGKSELEEYLAISEEETGLPAAEPFLQGADKLADAIRSYFNI